MRLGRHIQASAIGKTYAHRIVRGRVSEMPPSRAGRRERPVCLDGDQRSRRAIRECLALCSAEHTMLATARRTFV
jgi:hypothetical protein